MALQHLRQLDSISLAESDDWTTYTPSGSTIDGNANPSTGPDAGHHIPTDGRTYIIRAVARRNDNVLTLLDGNVVLAPINTRGNIYWACVETEGWFGFRNCSSNRFIGHGWDGRLICTFQQNQGHRQFTVTPMPSGGYIMQMLDWWTLRPIVLNPQHGLQKLGRTGNRLSEGVVWEFVPVEPRVHSA